MRDVRRRSSSVLRKLRSGRAFDLRLPTAGDPLQGIRRFWRQLARPYVLYVVFRVYNELLVQRKQRYPKYTDDRNVLNRRALHASRLVERAANHRFPGRPSTASGHPTRLLLIYGPIFQLDRMRAREACDVGSSPAGTTILRAFNSAVRVRSLQDRSRGFESLNAHHMPSWSSG